MASVFAGISEWFATNLLSPSKEMDRIMQSEGMAPASMSLHVADKIAKKKNKAMPIVEPVHVPKLPDSKKRSKSEASTSRADTDDEGAEVPEPISKKSKKAKGASKNAVVASKKPNESIPTAVPEPVEGVIVKPTLAKQVQKVVKAKKEKPLSAKNTSTKSKEQRAAAKAEAKAKAAEAKKAAAAEAKAAAAEAKRLAAEAKAAEHEKKKIALEEARRKTLEEKQAALDAKRAATQAAAKAAKAARAEAKASAGLSAAHAKLIASEHAKTEECNRIRAVISDQALFSQLPAQEKKNLLDSYASALV